MSSSRVLINGDGDDFKEALYIYITNKYEINQNSIAFCNSSYHEISKNNSQ